MSSKVMTEREAVSLYIEGEFEVTKKLILTRGEDDFREVYIVELDGGKIVVKHSSNTFTYDRRIVGYAELISAYNLLGIYCPRMIPTRTGEIFFGYTAEGRDYYIWAEEFAKHPIAEDIGEENYKRGGIPQYNDAMFRATGRVASAHLDMLDTASAYSLLEPMCPPDTTDEQTECAELFFDYIYKNLPEFSHDADEIKASFYDIKAKIAKVYPSLPTSCFQGDLNDSNILLDREMNFAGLIDFNLSGREPVVNYTVREALWLANYFEEGDFTTLDEYEAADVPRMALFRRNLDNIGVEYDWCDAEREIFPYIYRYMDSIWWGDVSKIKRICNDAAMVRAYLDFIKLKMARAPEL